MPTFEYRCIECDLEFEELHITRKDTKKYEKEYDCPNCGSIAVRTASLTNFNFKSKTPGNSGFHDLDYQTADKAVGRSAATKWEKINTEQDERNKARKKFGTNAIRKLGDSYVPLGKGQLNIREQAIKKAKEVKEARRK